jgi:signal transduction histidine kinase
MCTTFTARHKIPVELLREGEPPALAEAQELGVFRILQECLTNAGKHAHAKKVTVAVRFAPDLITLDIADDGKGFDPARTPKNHYGLINMRERARKAGGEVSISSAPGQGTQVVLTLKPIPRQSPDARGVVPTPMASS